MQRYPSGVFVGRIVDEVEDVDEGFERNDELSGRKGDMLRWSFAIFLRCPAVPPVSRKASQFQIDICVFLVVPRDDICRAVGNEAELSDPAVFLCVADIKIVFPIGWTDARYDCL